MPLLRKSKNDLVIFAACDCGHCSNSRIVGGQDAIEHSICWQIKIYMVYSNGAHSGCGGSIIDSKWVLTAAHCMTNPTPLYIFLDSSDHVLSDPNDHDENNGILLILNNGFNSNTFENDIAMIGTEVDFDFTLVGTFPVCLPKQGQVWSSDTMLTISGWGTLSSGGSTPDILQVAEVPFVSDDICDAYYPGEITDDMICAGRPGVDSCQGDSGGPMTAVNPETGKVELVGIVSWGIGCASAPGVYCEVAQMVDFIKNVAAGEGHGGCLA